MQNILNVGDEAMLHNTILDDASMFKSHFLLKRIIEENKVGKETSRAVCQMRGKFHYASNHVGEMNSFKVAPEIS